MAVKTSYPRKQPLRSCVACRRAADKRALVRFVRAADGRVACDPTGKQAGRGAYLCEGRSCFERARKSHLLDRALRVKISEADYERLSVELAALCHESDMVEEQ